MIDRIEPHELSAWLAQTGAAKAVLLDVREPWELATACVNLVQPALDCELIALPMGQVPARLIELDPLVPVACLCHHGARSLRVAAFLVQQGFAQVANVEGGIDAWSSQLDARVPRY